MQFDVIGAEGPKTFFSRLTKETIGHAYLFTGPQGSGKKTFARRLAQSLLCKRENVSEAEVRNIIGYDNTCSSCKLFNASDATRHPDFLEHSGDLKIGSSDAAMGFYEGEELSARDIVRQLSLESYSGGMRVLLLGDVGFATHHAANALLKFFEEPPSDIVLLLTSSTPGRLLSTIRSRLVDVHFPSLPRALRKRSEEEQALRERVAEWFFDVIEGASPEEGWATRETLDEGLETVKALARDWIALGAAGKNVPLVASDYASELGKLPELEDSTAVAVLRKIDDAQRLARTNVNPAMVSEIVRMALSSTAR